MEGALQREFDNRPATDWFPDGNRHIRTRKPAPQLWMGCGETSSTDRAQWGFALGYGAKYLKYKPDF
jgi:hypothetical protein